MTEYDKEVYQKGVAYLEEWEDVNYCEHNFKFKDEWLTDKEVVDLLNALHEENQQLKRDMKGYESNYEMFKETPILFVGGVPYVSVREIHKQAELVVLRENDIGEDNLDKVRDLGTTTLPISYNNKGNIKIQLAYQFPSDSKMSDYKDNIGSLSSK